MALKRRIFVSSPREEHLDSLGRQLKWAIITEIEALGYEPQVFGTTDGGKGLAAGRSWSPKDADQVMRRCIGAAILGLPIWKCADIAGGESVSLVSEYCHYEGALARAYGLAILSVLEEGVAERVFFNRYAGDPIIRPPAGADLTWVHDADFRGFLESWQRRLLERRDIFLAYSGELAGTAKSIEEILTRAGATVLDWKRDFVAGRTILEQVEEAARRTSGGVFLFTRDDARKGKGALATPRDNVIFEAGFFTQSKGHERVLIIREKGAKMPADLGGVVYETLSERSNTSDLDERIRKFVDTAL